MAFKFGKRSKENLATCNEDIQLVLNESLAVSQVDFGVSCGHRSEAEQKRLYASGRTTPGPIVTKIDGVNKKSKHNNFPADAADIYVFVPGKSRLAFDKTYLAYVGGVITATANRLYAEGKIKKKFRWGYNWDSDGEIGTDQRFQDMPHFETT